MYQEFSIFSSIPRVLCDTYCRYRPVCSIQAQSRPVPSIVCFLTVCINHCRLALTTVDTFSGTLHRRGCFIASRTTVKLELHSNRRIQYTYETSQIRLTVFVYPLVGFRLAAFLIGRVDMYGVGVQDVSGNLEDEGGDFDLDARWAPWNGGLGQVQLAWLRGELSNAKRAQQRAQSSQRPPRRNAAMRGKRSASRGASRSQTPPHRDSEVARKTSRVCKAASLQRSQTPPRGAQGGREQERQMAARGRKKVQGSDRGALARRALGGIR